MRISSSSIGSPLLETTTTCGSLLQELQRIWDEIGESESDRDKMLLQLEQECLDVYRRKVEKANVYKADLHQMLADAEAEIANTVSALGERPSFSRSEKVKGTLKEQIAAIRPALAELKHRREERVKEFQDVQSQIVKLRAEIAGTVQLSISNDTQVDERNLTEKKLAELKSHLQELQNEKNLRLRKVHDHISSVHQLSDVLSVDFLEEMNEIHPSLATGQPKSISNNTLARLAGVVHSLKLEKAQRLQKLQALGSTLIELWNLMDAPMDEQQKFDNVTSLISASIDNVSRKECLALDVIEQTEIEVERLNILKVSKMKEIVSKKHSELEQIYMGVHMNVDVDVDADATQQSLVHLIDSGDVNLSDLLSSMDDQIAKAKEQALSRKEILEKVEKWRTAYEEESWLEDYERDQNRYSAGRGAHKNLKRAEKARILVSKIPTLVNSLTAKVKAWEEEKRIQFLYDKMPLLESIKEYAVLRQEREEEKRKSREKKRLQEQLAMEQEAHFGSRPSPIRPPTLKKPLGQSNHPNTTGGIPTGRNFSTPSRHVSASKERRDSSNMSSTPVNYVALPKDDPVSRGG